MVTGVQDFGVFVSFYGGTSGLAHVSECGLAPGQKPPGAFEVGQGECEAPRGVPEPSLCMLRFLWVALPEVEGAHWQLLGDW